MWPTIIMIRALSRETPGTRSAPAQNSAIDMPAPNHVARRLHESIGLDLLGMGLMPVISSSLMGLSPIPHCLVGLADIK